MFTPSRRDLKKSTYFGCIKMETKAKDRDVYQLHWRGIKIAVSQRARPFGGAFRESHGHDLIHVEVRCVRPERAPLPITETGYKSLWVIDENLEQFSDAAAYVKLLLDEAAQSKEWQAAEQQAAQYNLF